MECNDCKIIVLRGGIEQVSQSLSAYSRVVVISDDTIYAQYGKFLPADDVILVPTGEEAKTLKQAQKCWHQMAACDRQSVVVALGGGAVGDLAGFVAGCFMRGIDLIQLPTSLLAMVDAAIGGKSGVNFEGAKNRIGLIRQPSAVYIDPNLLASLPKEQFWSGMAEVIKYAVIGDPTLFARLEEEITSLPENAELLDWVIERSVASKEAIVREDAQEKGSRIFLNYGHTIGHALESTMNYSLTHGEAVAIGMHGAALLSQRRGYVDQEFVSRQQQLIEKGSLPTQLPKGLDLDVVIERMHHDKKAVGGQLNFVLPRGLGKIEVDRVEPEEVRQVLNSW